MTPTSSEAQRIATLFRRKFETPWAEKEVKQFRKLVKAGCFSNPDDLRLIECYYVFERKKQEKGLHRRDLYTFLNNWAGELDRAKEWQERVGTRKEAKKTKYVENGATPVNDEDFKRAGEAAKAELERLRNLLVPK